MADFLAGYYARLEHEKTMRPIFVVSDLHAGDGGPCDNFAHAANGQREVEFAYFLDYVAKENGRLIVAGDLLDFWQANMSKVLDRRYTLLDRLSRMGARYVIGNHDIDLRYFANSMLSPHPFITGVRTRYLISVAGRNILIVHGHEEDPYCCNDYPDLGRASAIYTGMKERRNGSPFVDGKLGTYGVETRTLGRLSWVGKVWRKLTLRTPARQVIRKNVQSTKECHRVDALIFGHTHEPGTFANPSRKPLGIYNAGSWCGSVPSFVRITPDGIIEVFDWIDKKPIKNSCVLVVR